MPIALETHLLYHIKALNRLTISHSRRERTSFRCSERQLMVFRELHGDRLDFVANIWGPTAGDAVFVSVLHIGVVLPFV